MADIQYSGGESSDYGYEYGYEQAAPETVTAAADASRGTQLVNWAGALVSMGLVIGMAVWAFQMLVRDVTDVPVIRALEGPMRVAPEDPGGSIAENQGLAVNRLAEGEEAAPVPDELTLAPPPQDLGEVALPAIPETPIEQAFENASAAAPDPGVEGLVQAPVEDTDALIQRLLNVAQPLDGVQQPAIGQPPVDLLARADTIPISVPGLRRSPRPAVRPAGLSAPAPAPEVAAPDGGVIEGVTDVGDGFEIAAAELETGTRLVQLGAFDTPDLARTEWQRLSGNFPDFFLGRARVIEQAASGGQTFYRLRAHGFGDLSASRRFCAALVARGAACIPVTVR